jgi:hydrogenase expression/formation protein HypC
MCLAVPGEIIEIIEPGEPGEPGEPAPGEGGALRTGRVSFGGVIKVVCLACVPEAGPGDHVLVHAGFAIARIDEAHARELLEHLARLEPGGGGA